MAKDWRTQEMICLRCDHHWYPRKDRRPRSCPDCKSALWDEPKRDDETGPKPKGTAKPGPVKVPSPQKLRPRTQAFVDLAFAFYESGADPGLVRFIENTMKGSVKFGSSPRHKTKGA